MPKLYLHIGVEKTGTTSIQSFLASNRVGLESSGYHVPQCCRADNHLEFALACYRDHWSDELTALWGLSDQMERRCEQIEQWKEVFVTELSSTSSDSWIVSSEAFHSRFVHQEDIRRLSSFLRQYFEEINIVIYLRDPLQLALSLWSTGVKCGNVIDELPSPDESNISNLCHHASTLERWQASFDANLIVRLFDRQRFMGPSLFHDFCEACGIVWSDGFELPAHENQRLSVAALRVLNAINKEIPLHLADGSVNFARADLTHFIEHQHFGDACYRPTLMEIQRYRSAFSESNELVRRRYFPHLSTLFSEPSRELLRQQSFSCSSSDMEAIHYGQDATFTVTELALICSIIRIWQEKVIPLSQLSIVQSGHSTSHQENGSTESVDNLGRILKNSARIWQRITNLIDRLWSL